MCMQIKSIGQQKIFRQGCLRQKGKVQSQRVLLQAAKKCPINKLQIRGPSRLGWYRTWMLSINRSVQDVDLAFFLCQQ